jgi:hypothetical protein
MRERQRRREARVRAPILVLVALVLVAGCRPLLEQPAPAPAPVAAALDAAAERYVRLVLAVGEHDEDYVDAYYGPSAWRAEVRAAPPSLAAIRADAAGLLAELAAVDVGGEEALVRLRHRYLTRQTESLVFRTRMLAGDRFTFEEEARGLYDADPPVVPEARFLEAKARLDRALPGPGALEERVARFQGRFVIPPARLDTVFRTAVAEARRRTAARIRLPAHESFRIEYVRDQPWSGYNWYEGNAHSLIQVNVDFPITIDRAVDLAAHEGYPGHHVYNVLLEERLVRGRGWLEYAVVPLFSPQALIAEGTANYGIEMAFPGQERIAFERAVLFPLTELDPADVERYYEVQALTGELSYAMNEAARRFLNGELDRSATVAWLVRHTLSSADGAEQTLRFIERYGAYVINYNWGEELVRRHIEGAVAGGEERWAAFERLISAPWLPGDLGR